ncbi:MAG: 16S rRNA (guanine(527)-N(7))-methyltransferase RsmG [Candidatus Thiodiazotropha sp.]|jgi:16S rRNA (guanine527-N7)-methyltransferase
MVDSRHVEITCRQRLLQGASQMGMVLSDEQQATLLAFHALLIKWNKAYNLTAVRDPLEMIGRHLLDSLIILPYLNSRSCLDMGSGPGLPGIPLAIMQPQTHFVLLDSNSKKVRFLRQAVLELGLGNCEPVHARVEDFRSTDSFETLTARAFTALPRMLDLTADLRSSKSELLAMKGRVPEQEIAEISPDYHCDVIPLKVPFTQGERCLLRIRLS